MSRPGLLVQTAPPSSTSSKTLPKIPSEAIYAGTDFYFQKRHIFKDVSSGPNCINICAFSEKPALRVNKALAAERREQRSPSHWTAAFSAPSRERKKEKVEARLRGFILCSNTESVLVGLMEGKNTEPSRNAHTRTHSPRLAC